MLESSSLSIDEFIFASGARKSVSGRKRHVARAFATVSWFHEIRLQHKATSIYQLAAAFGAKEIVGTGPTAGAKTQWLGYKQGRHSPSEPVVRSVQARYPSGTVILRHPLWAALSLSEMTLESVMTIMTRLEPEIYAVAWRCMTGQTGQLWSGDGWNNTYVAMLERRAGLDALAAAVLAARWSKVNGHAGSTYRLCGALCRILLIAGPWLYAHGIARPLVEFINEIALSKGTFGGYRHHFWERGYLAAMWRLHDVAEKVELRELPKSARKRTQLRLDLLDDAFTIELSDLIVRAKLDDTLCMPSGLDHL